MSWDPDLWGPPDYRAEEHGSVGALSEWQCSYFLDDDEVENEKCCIQVLKILNANADSEIDKLGRDLVQLQSELAWMENEAWSELFSRTLTERIKGLDDLVRRLRNTDKNDVKKVHRVIHEEPVESLHDISRALLSIPLPSKEIQCISYEVDLPEVSVLMDEADEEAELEESHTKDIGSDSLNEREPLFCYPSMSSIVATHGEILQGDAPPSATQQQPKKTLAATIVENVTQQFTELVPKDIVQRSVLLFNPALFPYEPPPAAGVKRILFTDVEDELIARGILKFNNDWKAIQQHFLTGKSEHQIFFRAKNRSASKAPENPIKAVKRMKSSPLTEEEIGRIQEGLKTFKSDWTSVWRFIVPYRDPSLLPRQWRIAHGTQKSYRSDAAKKEKRRLYESSKRKKLENESRHERVSGKDNQADQTDGGNANADVATDVTLFQSYPYGTVQPIHQGSTKPSNATKSQSVHAMPRSELRADGARLVKLAPDLPPLNLPPSVRVIPQSAFRIYTRGQPMKVNQVANKMTIASADEHRGSDAVLEMHPLPFQEPGDARSPSDDCSVVHDLSSDEERGSDAILKHPLLFQEPGDARSPSDGYIFVRDLFNDDDPFNDEERGSDAFLEWFEEPGDGEILMEQEELSDSFF